MKVLVIHNYYQRPGGEDQVFESESALLEAHGHQVSRYIVHNDRVKDMNSLALGKATLWNSSSYRGLRALIRRERPQVVHFHNTFPLISPAGYHAARAESVPVVQTLHNYRLICPSANFFRDGGVCEDCLGRTVPWPGVLHACYRGSRMATGAIATMVTAHGALRTWTEAVDVYIALTEFQRQKYIEGGIPAGKIVVKPNFVHPDPGMGRGSGGYALFAGRLTVDKGVGTLLAAWEQMQERVPLKIIGDGPLANKVAGAAEKLESIEWLGWRPKEEVLALMKEARILVFPSTHPETFGLVLAEAFAVGLPVIASDLGSASTLVDNRRTGLHFRWGDPEDLIAKIEWALSHPSELSRMRSEVRAEFEAKFTAERNYQMLMDIYEMVLKDTKAGPP